MSDIDNDELDGICDLDAEMLEPTKDGDEVLGLVLFGDVDWTDDETVEHRAEEWDELFGGFDAT